MNPFMSGVASGCCAIGLFCSFAQPESAQVFALLGLALFIGAKQE